LRQVLPDRGQLEAARSSPVGALHVDLLIPAFPAGLSLTAYDRASARRCRHGWHLIFDTC
jgi:hypothetical protein